MERGGGERESLDQSPEWGGGKEKALATDIEIRSTESVGQKRL